MVEQQVEGPVRKRARTISTLTDEQIRRKRDGDREAQRALRQRQRSRIQALEEELAILTAERSQQDESAAKEISNLRESNEMLQHRLRKIRDLAGADLVRDQDTNERVRTDEEPENMQNMEADRSEAYEALAPQEQENSREKSVPRLAGYEFQSHQMGSVIKDHHVEESFLGDTPGQQFSDQAESRLQDIQPSHDHEQRIGYPTSPPLSMSISPHANTSLPSVARNSSSIIHHADEYLDGTISTAQPFSDPSLTTSPPFLSPVAVIEPIPEPPAATCMILPKHLPPTCPLDQILIDFLSSRRLLAGRGTPVASLIGPPNPSISALLTPELAPTTHASSRVMVDIVSTFKDVDIQEKLGFLYIMYSTMRWQISPTQETFERMPYWLRPTVLQAVVPHAAWIDNIPWPRMRDCLIQDSVKYPFREFSEMYAGNVKLEWPYEPLDSVIPKADGSGEVSMNPLFEKHIRKLEKWSIGEPFKTMFPELAFAMEDRTNYVVP